MNKRLRCIALCVLCVFAAAQFPLIADEKNDDHTPVPYTKAEFPLWQRELRRFEILSFGALPFVTLLSFWGYDMIRAIQHPRDPGYYPWPFKQADKAVALTEKEQLGVFLTAAGISVTIALIDITYRAIKRSAEKKRLERENAFTEDPIQFAPTTIPIEDEPEPTDRKPAEQVSSPVSVQSVPAEPVIDVVSSQPAAVLEQLDSPDTVPAAGTNPSSSNRPIQQDSSAAALDAAGSPNMPARKTSADILLTAQKDAS